LREIYLIIFDEWNLKKKNMLCQPKKNLLWLFNTVIPRNHDIFGDYLGFAWQYSQACGHPCCLCTFSYPISSFQSTLYLICFDTALCEQPHLSVMTLCDLPSLWRVSMIVFWTIAKSAVFPIIVFSKNKRYPEFILYGFIEINCHLLKLKCKYSNILRYWIFDFHEL